MRNQRHRARRIAVGIGRGVLATIAMTITFAVTLRVSVMARALGLPAAPVTIAPPAITGTSRHPLLHGLTTLSLIVGGLAWALWPEAEAAAEERG
jgi:hypothetical protein